MSKAKSGTGYYLKLALTLLDVLDYMEEVPIVTAYKLTDGSTTTRFPMGKTLDDARC